MRYAIMVMMTIMFLGLNAPVFGQEAAPAETEEAAPAQTAEQLVETIKGNETVDVVVETHEEGRSIVRLTVHVPYDANLLKQARELALKYARAFFTQEAVPVDALVMEFTNDYAGKILEVHLGRDRLYLKTRRGVRPLINWDEMKDHIAFFLKLRELEKQGEGPFDSVWFKTRLYPEDWPQNEILYGTPGESKDDG